MSRDKTVSAEPQTYFNNVDQAEYGRPDGFLRQRSNPNQQEFIDKQPLPGLEDLGARGRATPHTTK